MRGVALMLLVACGGDDAANQPDAAGTEAIVFAPCSAFGNKMARHQPDQSCTFTLDGVDWRENVDAGGLPLIYVAAGAPGDDFMFERVSLDAWRADAHTWTDDVGKNGQAVLLKTEGQCAWVRCL